MHMLWTHVFHPEASNLTAAQDGELVVVPRATRTPITMPTQRASDSGGLRELSDVHHVTRGLLS